MKPSARTLLAGTAIAATALFQAPAAGAQEFHLRISLETAPNHSRNISMQKFVDSLNEKSGGKIKAEIFPGAQLGPDRDMPKKLATGSIEMGAVGTWLISSVVPNADIERLPMFYGRDPEDTYAVMDGPVGAEINAEMEQKLRVKVLGKWLDLGYTNTYTSGKPLKDISDLKGLKIRIPGGAVAIYQYKTFGANPVVIPWPDLPLALIQGTVDGAQTTSESIRSAKLWESGLKYGLEERQNLSQYIPLVSLQFWNKLPKDLQQLVTDTWAARIDEMRAFAHERQKSAKEDIIKQGMEFTDPPKAKLAEWRAILMKDQESLVKDLNMDPKLVQKAMAALPQS